MKRIFENIKIAFKSLGLNKLRSFLTMLGIIIGVGSVVAIMSVGAGAEASINENIQSMGTNVINLMKGYTLQQVLGPGVFLRMFRLLSYMPYIAIWILVAAIAVWIIFGIKKHRLAKITAIALTLITVILCLSSILPYTMGRFIGNFPQNLLRDLPQGGDKFRNFNNKDSKGLDLNIYYKLDLN